MMTKKQTWLLLLLTAIYLLFELSFNARLLDVVGGVATQGEIDAIERYGRTLTGIAVSLFILQALIKLYNKGQANQGHWLSIFVTITVVISGLAYFATPNSWGFFTKMFSATLVAGLTAYATNEVRKNSLKTSQRIAWMIFVSLVSVGCVYASIENMVDNLVDKSSASFRHASLNIILIQKALVDGTVKIDGLTDGGTLFSQPEGKAFLALFPFMAVSVERLDEKIRDAKRTLITQDVEHGVGGPDGYYKDYRDTLAATKKQWDSYKAAFSQSPNVAEIQQSEWNNYLRELRSRGWTPDTVPYRYRDQIIRRVKKRISVPNDWDLADEQTFKNSVATTVNRKYRASVASMKVDGVAIPPGLSFPEFFNQTVIQQRLRNSLSLPKDVLVGLDYSTGDEFKRRLYEPFINNITNKQMKKYDALTEDFADGGSYSDEGKEMARAAIVPVIALFFSLIGAISHLCKTAYLSLSVVAKTDTKVSVFKKPQVVIPVSIFAITFILFAHLENSVTQSRLYTYLESEVQSDGSYRSQAFSKVCHIVAVGQGTCYPFNEFVRKNILQGVSFGYKGSSN